ncbi:hypothetical protein FH972_023019 [Carpinus fangiana]|uniref:DNA damage-binding protein CMR1 n=1 Tax=Carpinus fangiana TaxID=176857 RepID=A0A5N6KUF1_9ROSI|nr:hypothetical protein FH972_023019 [Carpinus fangiana]
MPPRKSLVQESEYEIQRKANIEKNKALLRELQLNAASAGLAPPKTRQPGSSSSATKKKPAPKKIKQEDITPRRISSRLKGIEADSEVAKRKAEEEFNARIEADRVKRQRVSGPLAIGDILVNGDASNWNKSGNWLRDVKPANPYERTFDEADIKATTSKELRELREKMSGLQLWQDIEPSRIKEDEFTPEITTFKQHTRTISAMTTTPTQPQNLYTASYDSSIRCLDLAKGVSVEVYAPSDTSLDEPVSGVSIPITDPNMLYFTTLNGAFGMHDTRTNAKSSTQVYQLSEKKIGGFSVHPLHPHLLATASLDRYLRLWDLRQMVKTEGGDRLPSLLAEHESRLSVSHAAFNAAGDIATSSYDDTIKIHHLAASFAQASTSSTPSKSKTRAKAATVAEWSAGKTLTDEQFVPTTVIPHNNQTGRWVTILRPHWQQRPSAVGGGAQRFAIGNMNRFVDVYTGEGEQVAQLGGDGITAVPAVAVFHPSCDWVAGGTASGKLCLWE